MAILVGKLKNEKGRRPESMKTPDIYQKFGARNQKKKSDKAAVMGCSNGLLNAVCLTFVLE